MFKPKDTEYGELTFVSNKVKRLIQILNGEVNKKLKTVPKVIIFVKDRVVAHYLKSILEKQTQLRSKFKHLTDLLDPLYNVSMAMGPRGKNLVNKAFKSTKQNEVVASNAEDSLNNS